MPVTEINVAIPFHFACPEVFNINEFSGHYDVD
jgi:hypothetical protein